jgi:hypothetical protein
MCKFLYGKKRYVCSLYTVEDMYNVKKYTYYILYGMRTIGPHHNFILGQFIVPGVKVKW